MNSYTTMNDKLRVFQKLLVLTASVFLITVTAIIMYYEGKGGKSTDAVKQSQYMPFDHTPKIIGDRKVYTAQQVRDMIKNLPDYQGDSLLIDDEGRISSTDGLIQSTIAQVYLVKVNSEGIKSEAMATGLPEPFIAYRTAIKWYIGQYGSKRLQPDSSAKK